MTRCNYLPTFGERLKQLRNERGLKQEDVGALVGLGKSTVCQWESGERIPAHPVLEKLADAFGVSLDYLVGRSDDRSLPWLSKLPTDMQDFVRDESQEGWPFLRLARGLKMQNLTKEEVVAILQAWLKSKGEHNNRSR